MKTSELIEYVAPGKEWALLGEPENELQYVESLTWISSGESPTWAALKAAEARAEYETARKAVEDTRRGQYQLISDPLLFGWQRGDNTKAEWLAAVDKIKTDNLTRR